MLTEMLTFNEFRLIREILIKEKESLEEKFDEVAKNEPGLLKSIYTTLIIEGVKPGEHVSTKPLKNIDAIAAPEELERLVGINPNLCIEEEITSINSFNVKHCVLYNKNTVKLLKIDIKKVFEHLHNSFLIGIHEDDFEILDSDYGSNLFVTYPSKKHKFPKWVHRALKPKKGELDFVIGNRLCFEKSKLLKEGNWQRTCVIKVSDDKIEEMAYDCVDDSFSQKEFDERILQQQNNEIKAIGSLRGAPKCCIKSAIMTYYPSALCKPEACLTSYVWCSPNCEASKKTEETYQKVLIENFGKNWHENLINGEMYHTRVPETSEKNIKSSVKTTF